MSAPGPSSPAPRRELTPLPHGAPYAAAGSPGRASLSSRSPRRTQESTPPQLDAPPPDTTLVTIDAVLDEIHARSPEAQVDGTACLTMLAQRTASDGAAYVDTYTPSVGHDVCAEGVRRVEPEDVGNGAGLHHNSTGHRSMADAFLATLTR